MKTERNTASQFCGTRFPGSPEDTQILAEVTKERPRDWGSGVRGVHNEVSSEDCVPPKNDQGLAWPGYKC